MPSSNEVDDGSGAGLGAWDARPVGVAPAAAALLGGLSLPTSEGRPAHNAQNGVCTQARGQYTCWVLQPSHHTNVHAEALIPGGLPSPIVCSAHPPPAAGSRPAAVPVLGAPLAVAAPAAAAEPAAFALPDACGLRCHARAPTGAGSLKRCWCRACPSWRTSYTCTLPPVVRRGREGEGEGSGQTCRSPNGLAWVRATRHSQPACCRPRLLSGSLRPCSASAVAGQPTRRAQCHHPAVPLERQA